MYPFTKVPKSPSAAATFCRDLAGGSSAVIAMRFLRVPTAASDLTKVSIYLDEATDAYLETVRAAARTARPRVDATRSAVVRLALTRLAEELNPAQVVAELQRNAASHTGPGRKRA